MTPETNLFPFDDLASVFEVIGHLATDPRVNVIHVPKGRSLIQGQAAKRVDSGETIPCNDGKSFFILPNQRVGMDRDSINITIRDTNARKPWDTADGYGFRTITIGTAYNGPEVNHIEVNLRGRPGFIKIPMNTRPLFPNCEDPHQFVNGMRELAQLSARIDKLDNKIASKKKAIKTTASQSVTKDGKTFRYSPPSGEVMTVVDENGERVQQSEPRFFDTAHLVPAVSMVDDTEFDGWRKLWTANEDVIDLHRKITDARARRDELQRVIRPIELGIIERHARRSEVIVGGVTFKLVLGKGSYADYPNVTAQKLETGAWSTKMVPKSRGEWICEEITVSPTTSQTTSNHAEAVTA